MRILGRRVRSRRRRNRGPNVLEYGRWGPRAAFTLVEILIAVMLTGLVASLALAPVVMTVSRVIEAQRAYTDATALSRALAFLGRDVSSAARLAPVSLIVEDRQALGGRDDDVLIVMSTSPARQGISAGSLVYKLYDGGAMRSELLSGLYRWVLPGVLPDKVDASKLKAEEGQLVLPGVTSFVVEVSRGPERSKEYKGALPEGLFVSLTRGDTKGAVDGQGGKDGERLETVVVFP